MIKTTIAGAVLASLACASPALAEKSIRTTEVSYADLDLTTEQGQDELERRINRAAKHVCRVDENTVGTRLPAREARQCYRSARSQLQRHMAQVTKEQYLGG